MPRRYESQPLDPARRRLLLRGLSGAGLLITGSLLVGCSDGDSSVGLGGGDNTAGGGGGTVRPGMPDGGPTPTLISQLGPLGDPDENGVRLPAGFEARVIAQAGQQPYAGSPYRWHTFPDGGATFAMGDGGWVYVSNSEFVPGGVGALRFDANGEIVDAYEIQRGTILNCAGGPTPWGTWLTCEEYDAGHVYECDPSGRGSSARLQNIKRALGTFNHEAAAIDPDRGIVYLTEDAPDGGFYRFICHDYPSLDDGTLQIAELIGDDPMTRRALIWHDVPNPNPALQVVDEVTGLLGEVIGEIPILGDSLTDLVDGVSRVIGVPTRYQLDESTAFDGGEGIWYHQGIVYFTTKGDNRVWAYDSTAETIEIIYDDDLFDDPILTGVDNVTVSPAGDILVAEDGGDMQIVALAPDPEDDDARVILPLVQIVGQDSSEITGPAFSPDGRRLYFSSQRGPHPAGAEPKEGGPPALGDARGITYEIRGVGEVRFFTPEGAA